MTKHLRLTKGFLLTDALLGTLRCFEIYSFKLYPGSIETM